MSGTVEILFLYFQIGLGFSKLLHPMIIDFDVLDYSADALHDQHTRIKRSVEIGTYQKYSPYRRELKVDVRAFNQ